MTIEAVRKVMNECKKDIYVVYSAPRSYYFTDEHKAFNFAKRVGSKDIAKWKHEYYYDTFYWDDNKKAFCY